MNPRSRSPFSPWLRLLLGLLGIASFGAGATAVFVSANGTGTGVLLAFGGTVFVLALLGDRVESLEFGGTKVKMRAAAAERYALADDAEGRGDSITAAKLRAEAQLLMQAASPVAAEYQTVRSSMPAGRARTMAMEGIVARARELAHEQPFDRAEVVRWLQEGSDEERVTALGLMQGKPELRDVNSALSAIKGSQTPFEQYHTLLLADMMIDELNDAERRRLAAIISDIRGDRRFRSDSDRWHLSERILHDLNNQPNSI